MQALAKWLGQGGLSPQAVKDLLTRLVETRYAFSDPFTFLNSMLCHAVKHQQFFVAHGPAKFLHEALSPPVLSPYEPFFFTPMQFYGLCALVSALILTLFVLFARRFLLPRLRRRFSSFK
jgi:hypothetical protein